MRSREDKSLVIARLDDGEDLFKSLEEVIEKHQIKSGLVVSGIGMLRDFTLGYFDGKEYQKKVFDEPCELVSLQGSISTKGETVIHLHTSLADEDNTVIGGHLFSAEVYSLNEIVIRKLEEVTLRRELHPKTGLKMLDFD